MEDNKCKQKEEAQLNLKLVSELIYENIWLAEQNIRLIYENNRLRKELRELKALERWWKGYIN